MKKILLTFAFVLSFSQASWALPYATLPTLSFKKLIEEQDPGRQLTYLHQVSEKGIFYLADHGVDLNSFPAACQEYLNSGAPGKDLVPGFMQRPFYTPGLAESTATLFNTGTTSDTPQKLTIFAGNQSELPQIMLKPANEYTTKVNAIYARLVSLIFASQGLEKTGEQLADASWVLRFLDYPKQTKENHDPAMGTHPDMSILTILGRQAKKAGETSLVGFFKEGPQLIPHKPGTLLVFFGSAAEFATNGKLKAVRHYVGPSKKWSFFMAYVLYAKSRMLA